jgi:hypothetical protein
VSLALFHLRKQKYQNGSIHRKLKVTISTILLHPEVQYFRILMDSTVELATRKSMINKINYLYVLKGPLGQKIHTDFKNDLKKFHTILEGQIFLIKVLR